MRQEKWLLIGLALVFSGCSGAKDAPSGQSDAQAGAGGGKGNLDAQVSVNVPIPRLDGATDVPSVSSGCSNSLECSGRGDNLRICSVPTRECVECLTSSDCAPGTDASVPGRECVKNVCVTRPGCTNSLDCPVGNVCDRSSGVCVQCAANTDCATDQICAGGSCRKRCASDIECTPQRLLCETRLGYCAVCVLDTDCPASQFCSQGECLRDVCTAGTTKCQGNAVATCNAAGSGWVSPVACKSNQSCRDTGSAGICMDRVCTPSAKTCATEGEKVVSCSTDGLKSTVLEDCAATGKVCAAGVCAAAVCTAGARFCQGLEVRQCSAKGESSSLVTACNAAQYCDGASPSCKTKACTPSQPACNGTVATTCDAVGAAPLAGGTDCAAQGLICSQGKCQTYVCTASSVYCDTGKVMQCSSDGLSSTLVSTCSASQYCDKGSCKAQVCQPNQPICNGKVATTCNADGSAYSPGGTDCSLTNQECSVGLCKDLVCTPNTYFCGEKNTVMSCNSTGLIASTYQTCGSTQYCDAGACKTQVCTPSLPVCDQKVATTCNDKGSGYEAGGTDCSLLTKKVCISGECKDLVCTPSAYFCQDNALNLCSSTGATSTVSLDCASTQYCDLTARSCKTRVCTPGAAVCNGSLVSTCKSDGSGPEAGGTACETGLSCDLGVCKTQSCTPSTYLCKDNDIYYCAANGLSSSLSTSCGTTQYCDDVTTSCKANVCTPNQGTCTSNNTITICNPEGSGFLTAVAECAPSGKVCSAGECAASALDTINPSPTSSSNSSSGMKLNLYSVTSTRTLTLIEQYLSPPTTAATMNWVVFSAESKTGPYTQTLVATTSTASTGARYVSSGPINFTLQAGLYYAIGLYWSTSSYVYYYYHASTTTPIPTSFGTMDNGYATTSFTSITYPTSPGVFYRQRLTTIPYTAP